MKVNFDTMVAAAMSQLQMGDISSDHTSEAAYGFRGWNYVAIQAVLRQVSRSIPKVVDRRNNGHAVPVDHPLQALLEKPNPVQTGSHFRMEQVLQMRLHGSAIVYNRMNEAGSKTLERYVIPHGMIRYVQPNSEADAPRGGVKIVASGTSWNLQNSVEFAGSSVGWLLNRVIPVDRLSIARYPHPFLKSDGASTTNAISKWIDSATHLDNTRMDFLGIGPDGRIIIASESDDPTIMQKTEDALNRKLKDLSLKCVVVSGKNQILNQRTAEELGISDQFNDLQRAIFSAHGVSRAMTGDTESMTYGAVSASIFSAIALSIQPDLNLLADEDTLDLADEYDGKLQISYECPQLEDPESAETKLQNDCKNGILTVGEIRTKRGLPLFGDERDQYHVINGEWVHPSKLLVRVPTTIRKSMAIGSIDSGFPVAVDTANLRDDAKRKLDILRGAGCRVTLTGMDDDEITKMSRIYGLDLSPLDSSHCWFGGQTLTQFADQLPDAHRQRLLDLSPAHEFGCVLLPISGEVAAAIAQVRDTIDPRHLDIGGFESEPHVTLLYGINSESVRRVVDVVRCLPSQQCTLGEVSAFPAGPDGVPIFIKVESKSLVAANAKLKDSLIHVETHPEYHAHITLGYVKPEFADRYVGPCFLSGADVELAQASVSLPGEKLVKVPLRKMVAAVAETPSLSPEQAGAYQLEDFASVIESQIKKRLNTQVAIDTDVVDDDDEIIGGSEWIGVDLDGTLAFYDGFKGVDHIGDPIPEMLSRVSNWLIDGKDVRIFTARVADPKEAPAAKTAIEKWCEEHIGFALPVTATKDRHMIELWDDRARQVELNTGIAKSMRAMPVPYASENLVAAGCAFSQRTRGEC